LTVKILDKLTLEADNVRAGVTIYETSDEYIPIYKMEPPHIEAATSAVLDHIRERLVEVVQVNISEITDPKAAEDIKQRFLSKAIQLIQDEFPRLTKAEQLSLAGKLVHDMLGLGDLELLINDPNLEEIVINSSSDPVWVYHKKFGWLKTNIKISSEEQIYNYSSIIGRKVGRQISNLNPLMDAHLLTGDRVNATLFPISNLGNTITIRKFARNPWTMTHFISPEFNTIPKNIAALLWLSMEYELNVLVAGGTASGKTSVLNAMLSFIPTNHRILSIEDTRELLLPQYVHWVPLTTREPNPEGKGEVTMLDLLVNSLRMRPDRIVVGEIRREREAEVLFEAMHTGHSVYSTIHADRAEQVKGRLTNPPINLPEELLESLHLVLVQFRHRKMRIRRTLEVAEVVPRYKPDGDIAIDMNVLYKWNPKTDKMDQTGKSTRLYDEITLHTGMSEKEINQDLKDKERILQWMVDHNINVVDAVGKVIADYYQDPDSIIDLASKNKKPSEILTPDLLKKLELNKGS